MSADTVVGMIERCEHYAAPRPLPRDLVVVVVVAASAVVADVGRVAAAAP